MNLYLIGYRCTGKTSVGEILAEKLGWDFVDADRRLVGDAGKIVAEIVAESGWEAFRNLESETLKKISSCNRHVVATGGGVILRPENRKLMNDTGTVVWLTATPETIALRMGEDSNTAGQRPGLTDKGAMEEILEVLYQRIPLYEKAMDFQIETDQRDLEEICASIIKRVKLSSDGSFL